MINKAIEKVKAEMEKEKGPHIQAIGQFLLQHLENNPADAEKMLVEDKTIVKSFDAMRKEAEKKKIGNCAVLTDQEGFQIVLTYYGIKRDVATVPTPTVTSVPTEKSDIEFDVKLDDLLKI